MTSTSFRRENSKLAVKGFQYSSSVSCRCSIRSGAKVPGGTDFFEQHDGTGEIRAQLPKESGFNLVHQHGSSVAPSLLYCSEY